MDLAAIGTGFLQAALAGLRASAAEPKVRAAGLNQGDAGQYACDAVSVRLERIVPISASDPVGVGHVTYMATWQLSVSRPCWPTLDQSGKPPSIEQVDAASTALLHDAFAVHAGLRVAQQEYWLAAPDSGIGSDDIRIGALARVPPRGGCAGWTVQLEHVVDGYSFCVTNPYT